MIWSCRFIFETFCGRCLIIALVAKLDTAPRLKVQRLCVKTSVNGHYDTVGYSGSGNCVRTNSNLPYFLQCGSLMALAPL